MFTGGLVIVWVLTSFPSFIKDQTKQGWLGGFLFACVANQVWGFIPAPNQHGGSDFVRPVHSAYTRVFTVCIIETAVDEQELLCSWDPSRWSLSVSATKNVSSDVVNWNVKGIRFPVLTSAGKMRTNEGDEKWLFRKEDQASVVEAFPISATITRFFIKERAHFRESSCSI